ncbi:hypothetical protein BKA70DRAFT_180811 [Coprinopsis sp. MPI-PUGE-AT-0042]|nr:hypothetical protein BKA70DRAFT_180811 [Coprinopsis sp. MPI-PUGE-AT-0042]
MDTSSGYQQLSPRHTSNYAQMPIETTRMLIGRQTTIQTPPPILPSPPNAPSPIVIMGAMNASFVSDGILYGIHLVLFAMCCYILLTFQRRIQWFILAAVCAMFAISTADIGLSIKLSTTDLWALHQVPPQSSIDKMPPKAVLFVTNNLLADILLFHRCWVIWGRPRLILWIALVCLTADSIWGYMGHATKAALWQHTFRPLYLWTVFALNVTVTAAAAGRIYWVSVVAYPPVERRVKRIYRAIISTLVESAAIYSSCILVFLLWSKFAEASAYWVVPQTMMTRLVAIMPTLMIVQTGFSHRAYRCCCPNNHDSKNHNESVILDTVISGVRDLHHSPHRGDLEMGVDVDRHNREVAEINLRTVVSGGREDSKIGIELDEKILDEKVDSDSSRTP